MIRTVEVLQAFGVIVGALLILAGAINTVGSAVEKVSKARKAAKAPNDEQNTRLDALEERMDKHDVFLDSDNKRLEAIEKSHRVTMRALLALLEHGIDGNSVTRMKSSKDELEDLLINK